VAGTSPRSVTVDPSGKFAYVTNQTSNDVSAYTINSTTGALTSVGVFAAGTLPLSVTVDPSGKFAYVANTQSANVSAYTINTTTGALSEIPGGPFDSGAGPASVTTTRKIQ
jgi:6-phosphogluconolactonase (cycloisomerase 2 family)